MANKFTQAQVADIYQHIVGQDAEFVKMMAKAAIESSADIQADMWADREPGTAVPDENDVRNMAVSFSDDMFADFVLQFKAAMTEAKFELRLRLKHHTTFVG